MSRTTNEQLKEAVATGNEDNARIFAETIVKSGSDILEVVNELSAVMHDVGAKFGRCEIFLSGLMLSATAMQAAMNVFQPELAKTKGVVVQRPIVVIGTVQGDIHDIGKNIVSALLAASGFEVVDLGVDVPARRFAEKAQEKNADIVAASSLMSTTIPSQMDMVKLLQSLGIRESFKILVGGGAVTAEDAERMGADGFATDAAKGVEEAKRVLGIK